MVEYYALHSRWLIDFLETTSAFLRQGKEWQPTELRLRELKQHAEDDLDFLECKDTSKLETELKSIADDFATRLKDNLTKRLEHRFKDRKLNDTELVELKIQLRTLLNLDENKSIIKEFEDQVKRARDLFRQDIRKKIKLKDVFDKEYNGDDDIELLIVYGVAAILSIPVASLIMLVLSAKDEIDDFRDGKSDRHISKQAEYFHNKVQTILTSEKSFINEQIKQRSKILHYSDVTAMNDQMVNYIDEIQNLQQKVWRIYICNVKHEYKMRDLEPEKERLGKGGNGVVCSVSIINEDGQVEDVAKKVIEAKLRIIQSQTEKPDQIKSISLPHNFDIYRECLIMR